MATLTGWVNRSPQQALAYAREALKVNANEEIWGAMNDTGITQAELAKRMGRTRPCINAFVKHPVNLTLGNLAEIAYALGYEVKVTFNKRRAANGDGKHG